MFQLYSKGCEHTLNALIALGPGKDRVFTAREFCAQAGIPESYTRKVLQALVRRGLMQAVPGPGGGYRLNRPAKEISVLDVIQAVDGEEYFNACVLGGLCCNGEEGCALHATWLAAKEGLLKHLSELTLDTLKPVKESKDPAPGA